MNWIERIKAAKKRGRFEDGDVLDAGSWKTCAVGESRRGNAKVVPVRFYSPLDEKLHDWGTEFWRAVRDNCFTEALRLYRAISRRTKQLIAAKGKR
jgi:hypothetical protein